MQTLLFEDKLIAFILDLCRIDGLDAQITRDTPLFADRLIDSKRMIDLMEFVERELGIVIPDNQLTVRYFGSAAAIAREFCTQAEGEAPAPAAARSVARFGRNGPNPSRAGVSALVASGDIAEADNGCVVLRGAALELHDYFARVFASLAVRHGAQPRRYATLLALSHLQRTDYFKSFPQHATFCTCLRHDGATLQSFVADVKDGAAVDSAAHARLESPALVLSSAVCYHCYAEHAGARLNDGLTVLTAQGQCFRNERGAFRALDRQYEFTMREIILLGDARRVELERAKLMEEVIEIAEEHGLAGVVETASDMFYRGDVAGRARALQQQAADLKHELRVRMDEQGASLAVASFNLHGDYFGRAFGIRRADDTPASTGCVAFGIERWVSAFLSYYGAAPARWPARVRQSCERARAAAEMVR